MLVQCSFLSLGQGCRVITCLYQPRSVMSYLFYFALFLHYFVLFSALLSIICALLSVVCKFLTIVWALLTTVCALFSFNSFCLLYFVMFVP